MSFSGLPPGVSVFLDTNTFVYYFQPHAALGTACQQLVERIELQQLAGYTSTHVVGEMAHRMMTIEAGAQAGWSGGKVTQRLRQHPATLQGLTRFEAAVDAVLNSRIQVLAVGPGLLGPAVRLSRQHGLLINDALIVAVMQAHGLTNLASNDGDFDRVPGITRYAPA